MPTYSQLYNSGYNYLNANNFNNQHTIKQHITLNQLVGGTTSLSYDFSKFHVVSFASTNTFFSKERFFNEAATFGFKYIKIYTEHDFSEEYVKLYGSHFNDKRGYGYWSWKSYIIREEYAKLKDDEYLVYADCGSSFIKKNSRIFNDIWVRKLNDSATGILCPSVMHYIEMEWNKADCIDYMNERYHTSYQYSDKQLKQNAATVILFRKTDTVKQFIDEWFDICNNHYDLITDKPSVHEHPYLKEHRHDLSVFSMLCHIYNASTIDTFNNGIDDKINAPIFASKIKYDRERYKRSQINQNVDIFICTHKDFDAPYNPAFRIVCGKGLLKDNYPMKIYEDNENDNPVIFPKEYSYAEGSRISYIRNNMLLKDYVGLVHYRKYFKFNQDPSIVPDINQLFRNYDIVVQSPTFSGLYSFYNSCHCGKHLLKCIEIGKELFPEYTEQFDRAFLENQPCYYCNMFIMKRDDFYKMCDFVYSILLEFDDYMGFQTDGDIYSWVEEHIDDFNGSKNVSYQSRIDGFLFERLFCIWIWQNFSTDRICTVPINVIGNYSITYKKSQTNKDTKIYVCTHKDFNWNVVNDNDVFMKLDSRTLNNKYTDIEYNLAEIYHLYDIYLNRLNDSKYIGLAQYRKVLDIQNNNLDYDLQYYDIILPKHLNFGCTVYSQVVSCASKPMFDSLMNIVETMYPDYILDVVATLNAGTFYAYNMFIMSSEKLKDYCEWVYPIIDAFLLKHNFKCYQDVYDYVDKNRKEFPIVDTHPNPYYASVKLSTRFIGGFVERLFAIYIHHNFKNIKEYDIVESGLVQTL